MYLRVLALVLLATSAAASFWAGIDYLFSQRVQVIESAAHPIIPLLRHGRATAQARIRRQSRTLPAAVARYKARYGRSPPPGFDRWWAFAKARNHTYVDDYDGMMDDLRPFRALPASVLRHRTRTLGKIHGISLLSVVDGQAQVQSNGRWATALAFQEMLADFIHELPDMIVALNERPEGRILPNSRGELDLSEWADVATSRKSALPLAANGATFAFVAVLTSRLDRPAGGARALSTGMAARRLYPRRLPPLLCDQFARATAPARHTRQRGGRPDSGARSRRRRSSGKSS